MAQLTRPIFQQGAPIDIGELEKIHTNVTLAYQQSSVLANATSNGQSQAFVSITTSGSINLTLDDNGVASDTVTFQNIFNFGLQPIVVASLVTQGAKILYTVSTQITTPNSARIYVYSSDKLAKNKQVTVNWIATANKPIVLVS